MEHKRFDDLTKILASGVSRREMLRKVGVGITGAALAALLPARAPALAKTKTISCKISEKGRDADGNKISVHCEVECTGEAGYCVVCGTKDKENDSLSCSAACCVSDDPTICTAPDKKTIQDQCQQGRVKIYKEKG